MSIIIDTERYIVDNFVDNFFAVSPSPALSIKTNSLVLQQSVHFLLTFCC